MPGIHSDERQPRPTTPAQKSMSSSAGDVLDGLAGVVRGDSCGCVFPRSAGGRHSEADEDARSPVDHRDVGGVDVVPE